MANPVYVTKTQGSWKERKTKSMYTVMQQDVPAKFLDGKARKGGRSESTKNSYAVALSYFEQFLEPQNYTLESVVKALATGKQNVYTMLNDFAGFMSKKYPSLAGTTVRAYMAGIRSYLQSFGDYDIDISPRKFKMKVNMPSVYTDVEDEEEGAAIDAKDIREILLHCSNRRLKPFLVMQGCEGARTIETASLRVGDLELDKNKINIRKEFTKTKKKRYAFISDEAVGLLREWIEFKYRERRTAYKDKLKPVIKDEDLIFGIKNEANPRHIYQRLRQEFNKILTAMDMDKRKDGGQRREITLNSFRKFAKSTVAEQASTDYSEWLIGHKNSTYYKKKEYEKWQIYKTKCMKFLTFLDYAVIESTGKGIQNQLSEKDQRIESLEKQMKSQQEQLEMITKSMNSFLESKKKIGKELPLEIIAHALDPTFEGKDPKRPLSEWRKEREALDRRYGITDG